MSKTWLALDMSFLAYRALHTTGELEFGGDPTGVIFGVLRDIPVFQERFGTQDMIFCFDYGKGLREQKYPSYKETRRKRVYTDEQNEMRDGLRSQLDKLRTQYLEDLGYGNVFWQNGYEADDIMASVAKNLSHEDRMICVSADTDLWQLLSFQTACYNPITKKFLTAREFRSEWGIDPDDWREVKALSGCPTDDVAGIDGVGPKTAAKYCRGELRPNAPTRVKIYEFTRTDQYRMNLELVSLPYPQTVQFTPRPDAKPDPAAWDRLCEKLGMSSLVGADDRGSVREGIRRGE